MPNFPIVDTHVHLWDPGRLRYPWLEELPTLKRPFLLDDYREASKTVAVETMVFVQSDCERSRSLDEANWITELAREEGRLKAIVADAPIEQGEGCRSYLEELRAIPLVRGVRRLLQPEPDPDFCLRPGFLEGLKILAEFGMSFDICIEQGQMASATEMVKRSPEVSFILDHIGKPDIRRKTLQPWATQLKQLSELPNVVCKISGMITEADHETWSKEDLRPYIDHVIDCFGFDRVLFGGDWPVVNLAGTFDRWVEALDWALEACSEEELLKLLAENARRVYRL